MRKNVLVFSGGSYPAIQIYYCLQHSLLFNPIAASSYEDHSQFVFKDSYCNLPYIQEASFLKELVKLVTEKNIEFIIPTHDTIALYLMEHQKEIPATIVCSEYETTLLCRYKSKTYKQFECLSFVPQTYKSVQEVDNYPVFIKKDDDQGSRNAFRADDVSELTTLLSAHSDMVICEYLPGKEITIDCFTNKDGALLFSNARMRDRLMNGISARSYNIPLTDELQSIVLEINANVRFRGYWFVQLKQDNQGMYKLLEICTRFAGTFGLSKSLDVNLPLLALCDFSGLDVSVLPNDYHITSDKTYIDRYKLDIHYDIVYVDFDDTIVFERQKYNTFMMMFLYQCYNKNKKMILITKHKFCIKDTMMNIKFPINLFDEIIEVPAGSFKYEYMDTTKRGIFIDNAFVERKAVKEHLKNLYTFDVSNVDCLIDWS